MSNFDTQYALRVRETLAELSHLPLALKITLVTAEVVVEAFVVYRVVKRRRRKV